LFGFGSETINIEPTICSCMESRDVPKHPTFDLKNAWLLILFDSI
jgi:hypothetical protein